MIQEYEKYTAEDHEVWSKLYNDQMRHLPDISTSAYLEGIRRCGFKSDKVPNFNRINEALKDLTGWKVYVVPGLIPQKPFFEHLSRKEFPATTWLRSKEDLDYTPEPDMFHDVFGHIPMLSEPFFCDFLNGLSKIALKNIENENAVKLISRLYWYTVEFGLIKEDEEVKIYGAGILSSPGESLHSVQAFEKHEPYDPQKILDSNYNISDFQAQYFVIESYEQLFNSLGEIESIIDRYVLEGIVVESYTK